MWYFLGGIFGGPRDHIIRFADIVKPQCLGIIAGYHTLPWEVNVWYTLYHEHKDLFDVYYADHKPFMITRY